MYFNPNAKCSQLTTSQAFFLSHYQTVWCFENALQISVKSVNDRSELDLLTLEFDKNALITKFGISREVSIRDINALFELSVHAILKPASDLDLNIKVKCWPNFGDIG